MFFPYKRVKLLKTPPPIEKAPVHLLKGAKILIVDDDEPIRCIFRQIMENVGCEVYDAATGQEAVDRFREIQDVVGCVLLDFSLPDFGGNIVLDKIRAMRSDLPVLLISGYPEEYLDNKMTIEKPNLYLQKPCGRDDIINNIKILLAKTPVS